MIFDDYIAYRKANGPIDKDGAYGYQCMDLYNDYCEQVLELIGVGADCAKNILNNEVVKNNFDIVLNYADFLPKKGDIAVWTGSEYGHVGIVEAADLKCFRCLEQNWKPQQLTEEYHDYFYMAPLYFLRPHNQNNMEYKKEDEDINKEIEKALSNIKEEVKYIENLLRG